jgi:predicted HAD superfamily Cof-like phosphohydrolase
MNPPSHTRSMYEDIEAFHKDILGLEHPKTPTLVNSVFAIERFRFLCEECDEFLEASERGDIVGAVDGLLDTIYVALGTLWQMGIPVQACWDAVQTANMAKVKGVTKRGNKIDAVKPPGWTGPEQTIAQLIGEAINRADDA